MTGDLTGLPALDVVIGLAFMYFVFSVIASGINEAVASVFALRARTLEQGLRRMLTSPSPEDGQPKAQGSASITKLVQHRLIKSLVKHTDGNSKRPWRHPLPSYLPARTFALTLLDTLASPPTDDDDSRSVLDRLNNELKDARAQTPRSDNPVRDLPNDVRDLLQTWVDDASGDIAKVRSSLESWFDDTMNRASGWYKRRTTIILLAISAFICGALNLDSFQIASSLWTNDALRSAVVAQAQKTAGQASVEKAAKVVDDKIVLPIGWKTLPKKPSQSASPAARAKLSRARATLATDPRLVPRGHDWWAKLAGLAITALALTLGAPFWFDLLQRLVNLRGTGPPEASDTPAKAAATSSS